MYVTLVCFIITSFIFIIYGKSFINLFDTVNETHYSVIDSFFIGLCVVGAILNIWSIFLPTNIFALGFLLISSISLFYLKKKYFFSLSKSILFTFKKNKIFVFLGIITILIVLFYGMVTPRHYDSYLYHINAIQWNESYRAVPGLANFHDRLGFNSSMFVLSAGFSFYSIYNQYIFIINSLCVGVFTFWILKQIVLKKGIIGLFLILFIYFFIQQYSIDISSPSADLLPNLFVGYVLISMCFDNNFVKNKYLIYVVIPLFCLTLKLSTFPIAIISLIVLYNKNKNYLTVFKKTILFGSLFILPWIIRNVILSGYIIYPFERIDIFNFDWKVPKERVIETKSWIYSWARIPMKDYKEVLTLPFKEWFSIWWDATFVKNKRFFILASIAPFILLIFTLLQKNKKNHFLLIAVVIASINFILWFLTAPDFRFSFGSILFLALSPIFIFEPLIFKKKKYLIQYFY